MGYGYREESFRRALEKNPHLIACDAGSTDPGPNYLGMGKAFVGRDAAKRDLKNMLIAGHDRKIPVIIGTSGGAGGGPHLQWTREIVEEVARENDLHFTMALINSEQSKDYVGEKLDQGKVNPLWPMGPLTKDTLDKSTRIVAMAGVEPYVEALSQGAQVILAGRSDDAAIFASLPIKEEFDPALGWVAGKLLECGAACTVPRQKYGSEGLMVSIREDYVLVEAPHPGLQCTPLSVGTFFLHENETPLYHTEPSGILDLSQIQFEAVDDRRVKITGARFVPSEKYTVRLEGVEFLGYRCICVSTTRDPVLVNCIDTYIDSVRSIARQRVEGLGIREDEYKLVYRIIGKDSVMGSREPVKELAAHELGVIIEAVAPTQDMANEIVGIARQAAKNGHYEGKLCDEGCITFPYSPSDIPVGPCVPVQHAARGGAGEPIGDVPHRIRNGVRYFKHGQNPGHCRHMPQQERQPLPADAGHSLPRPCDLRESAGVGRHNQGAYIQAVQRLGG